jgi:uncharacterized membrane protein YqhA
VEAEGRSLVRTILASSRFFIAIAVLASFVSAIALIVYCGVVVLDATRDAFTGHFTPEGAKDLAVEFIEMIDFFLLGTVLYIVALGLYELFVDDQLPMPGWLRIHDLDDLKDKLMGVVIVLLGVTFLGRVVTWDGSNNILYFGTAIALVILALGAFLAINARFGHRALPPAQQEQQEPRRTTDRSPTG